MRLCVCKSLRTMRYRFAVRNPRFWQHRDLLPEWFYKRVRWPRSADECWEWSGALSCRGQHPARVSWLLHCGPPGSKMVCHECDNTRCVNPNHLWLGTARENTRDAVLKERVYRGGKGGYRGNRS